MDPTIAGLLGVLLGVSIKAGVDAIAWRVRTRREDRIAIEERLRPWRLEQLRATRELLIQRLAVMTATVRGDLAAARAHAAGSDRNLEGNIALLGNAELVAEYQAVAVALREALGRRLSVELQVRVNDLEAAVLAALDAQTERVLCGMPLMALTTSDRERLFNSADLARRMRLADEDPGVTTRVVAWVMNRRGAVRR